MKGEENVKNEPFCNPRDEQESPDSQGLLSSGVGDNSQQEILPTLIGNIDGKEISDEDKIKLVKSALEDGSSEDLNAVLNKITVTGVLSYKSVEDRRWSGPLPDPELFSQY